MSDKEQTWYLANEPPNTGRFVMLRFAPHGRKNIIAERMGFFWRVSGGHYAFWYAGPFNWVSCHPTHWRELTEQEGQQ